MSRQKPWNVRSGNSGKKESLNSGAARGRVAIGRYDPDPSLIRAICVIRGQTLLHSCNSCYSWLTSFAVVLFVVKEMDNSQIENALTRLFDEEGHRIVFWNEPDQEFAITLSLLNLPEGLNILRLDQVGALEVKVLIERDDPSVKGDVGAESA